MVSLPFEEVVVAAAWFVRILVTDTRPRLVDRASTRAFVEEHTHRSIDLVLLMAKNLLTFPNLREALSRRVDVEIEVLRQTLEIAVLYDDPVVAAAVGRTLQTVVEHEVMAV
jgi:hypothetical protein